MDTHLHMVHFMGPHFMELSDEMRIIKKFMEEEHKIKIPTGRPQTSKHIYVLYYLHFCHIRSNLFAILPKYYYPII